MSARTTAVTVDGHRAWLSYGHDDPRMVIAQTRARYEAQRAEADRILAGIDAGRARVFHQRGIYKVTDKREVTPDDQSGMGGAGR